MIVAVSDGGGTVVMGITEVGVGLPAGVFRISVAVTSVGTGGRGRGLQATRIKNRTKAMGIWLLFFRTSVGFERCREKFIRPLA